MKKITKKSIAILLALGFTFTSLPSTMVSFAADAVPEEGVETVLSPSETDGDNLEGAVPEEKVTSFVYEDGEIYVTANLNEADALPQGTKLVVKEISADSYDEFDRNVYYWANDVLNASLDRAGLLPVNSFFYDMYFEYEGNRQPVNNAFYVHLAYKQDKILDPGATWENVRVYHLDDNDYTGVIEAADTYAYLDVNAWGAVTYADFTISRFNYSPLMITMFETGEAYDARMAALEEESEITDGSGEHVSTPDDESQNTEEDLHQNENDEDDGDDQNINEGNEGSGDTSSEGTATDTSGTVTEQTDDGQGGEDGAAAEGTGEGSDEEESSTKKVIYMDDEEEEDADASGKVITTEDTEGQEDAETSEQTDGEEEKDDAEDTENTEETEEEPEEEPEPARTYYSSWGSDVSITILLSNPSQVPDSAEVVVTPVTPKSGDYNYDAYIDALNNSSENINFTAENTLLYDIRFIDTIRDENGEIIEQIEYEPEEGSVKVILKFNQNQLSNEINAENNEDVTVNHLVTDTEIPANEVSAEDIAVVEVDASVKLEGIDTVTFVTDSFSVYAFTYTVDFHYEGIDYSINGSSQILLSKLIDIMDITDEDGERIRVEDIESVEFTDEHLVTVKEVSGVITYNGEENVDVGEKDFLLTSEEAFDTEEMLTIILADGTRIVVNVTDAQETTNLNSLLSGLSITTSEGESVIQDGDKIITTKNESYNISFTFKETEDLQFANHDTLIYQVPQGVEIKNTGVYEFDIRIGTRVITGNTAEVVTAPDGSQTIQFKLNTNHKNFKYLDTSKDVEITRSFTAQFSSSTTHVEFGTAGTFGYSTKVEDKHNASVKKTGYYDSNQKKMVYKAIIHSEFNDSENVNVKDTMSGSALTNAAISAVYYSDANGNKQGDYSPQYTTNSSSGNGFDITLPKIEKDRYVTVEYTADVIYANIANNGNATFSETGNTVFIDVPGDSNTSDNTSTHEEKGITYSSVEKVSTSVSDVFTEGEGDNAKKYRIVTWKVTANKEQLVSLKGSNITDTLFNNNEVEYYGDGLSIKKILNGTTTTVQVPWADVGVNDLATAGGWSYPVTDEGNYAYEISYQTKVDITGWTQSKELVNAAKTKYDEDTAKVVINPDQNSSQVTDKNITVNKSATKVSEETITWKISVNVPAGWEPADHNLVITDTLPHLRDGTASDTVQSVTIDGYTYPSDYSYEITKQKDGNQNVVGDNQLIITIPDFTKTDNNRTINITVVTNNNEHWMEYAASNDWASVHTNTVGVKVEEGHDDVTDSDNVTPKKQTLTKTLDSVATYNVYEGEDENKNPILVASVPLYRFEIVLTGVNSDPVRVSELFDTDLFEVVTKDSPINQGCDHDYLAIRYGNYSWDNNEADHKATYDQENNQIVLENLPRTEGNAYYGYYKVILYLYVKSDKLDEFKSLIAEQGTPVTGETNVTAKQYTFTNTADWDGTKDTAEFKAKIENLLNKTGNYDSANKVYHYTITFNPEKLKINGGTNFDLSDILNGNIIDRTTIRVNAVNAAGNTVEWRLYQTYEDAAADEFDGIQVVYADNSYNLAVYDIPDQTSIIIYYDGKPDGSVTIDKDNKVAVVETSNTVEVLDYRYRIENRQEYKFINKRKTDSQDNIPTFTIELNQNKIKLNQGTPYELTDSYSGDIEFTGTSFADIFTVQADPTEAVIDNKTVQVADYILAHITETDNTFSFLIPDETHVTITYTGTLVYQTNSEGDVYANYSNTATAKDVPVVVEGEVHSKILSKEAGAMVEDVNSDHVGYIPFEIVFNPLGQTLNDGQPIELKDSYTNLLVDYSSISYTTVPSDRASLIEYDYSGTVGTYYVPDATKVVLTYYARPDFSHSTSVEWSNIVEASGYRDSENGSETMSTEGSGYGSIGNILWLYKYESGHMERPINDVKFALYMDVEGNMEPVTRDDGTQVTFTTTNDDEKHNGYVLMTLQALNGVAVKQEFQDGSNSFKEDTVYYLKEITELDGYYKNDSYYNFVIHDNHNAPYSKPSYLSGTTIYLFEREDIVKVSNDKITTSVSAQKYWVNPDGSYTWPSNISSVVLKLQQKVGEDGDWEDISEGNGNIPSYYWNDETREVVSGEDGSQWTSEIRLSGNNNKAVWNNLDLNVSNGETPVYYQVVEVSVNGVPVSNGQVTVDGITYDVNGGIVSNGKTYITNSAHTNVDVRKVWTLQTDNLSFAKPEGATVASQYLDGDTVTVSKNDLLVQVRLHRYVYKGGDRLSTYDFTSDASYTVFLSSETNWTAEWNDLPTAGVDSNGNEIDYVYEVEEVLVTVPMEIMRGANNQYVDISSLFTATVSKSGNSIVITNTLEDDSNYYLSVTKTWKDANGNVTDGDPVQIQLLRDSVTTTAGGNNSSANLVPVIVQFDNNPGDGNIGVSANACVGEKVRFTCDTFDFQYSQWDTRTVSSIDVYKRGAYSWELINSYPVSSINNGKIDIDVVDTSKMCILIRGNTPPKDAIDKAHITLSRIATTSESNVSDEVLMPVNKSDYSKGFKVDPTGNYVFTLNAYETINFPNLPYTEKDGNSTSQYTYRVVEKTTGSFSTTVTYSPEGSSYNPAPVGSDATGSNGSVEIVNQTTIVEENGSAELHLHKQDKSGTAMQNVSFTLSSTENSNVASGSTDNSGNLTLTIPGSVLGKHNGSADTTTRRTFTLTETVPEGYREAGPWTVTVQANGTTETVQGGITTITYNWNVVSVGDLTGNTGTYTIINTHRDAELVIKKTIAGVQDADLDNIVKTISFTVTDEDNNKILDNVKLDNTRVFTKGSDNVYSAKLTTADYPLIVPDGKYKVVETTTDSEGYILKSTSYEVKAGTSDSSNNTGSKTGTLTLSNADTSKGEIDFTNTYEPAKINITVVKKDGDEEHLLEGAEFSLTKAEKSNDDEEEWVEDTSSKKLFKTNVQGVTTLDNLTPGYYILREEKAPDGGYIKTDEEIVILVKVENNSVVVSKANNEELSMIRLENQTITVKNSISSVLPSTGGIGTTLFTILGGLLIVGAGAALLIRSQRRRKKNQN